MSDIFTKKKRSEVMSRIRSRGNKDTELALMKVFRQHRITGWRRHVVIKSEGERMDDEKFRVRPDFVFPKLRLIVFVDGCFWHACPKHATKPKTNVVFWRKKFARNVERDRLVTRTLHAQDWRVLRIWEHELAAKNGARLLARLQREFAVAP